MGIIKDASNGATMGTVELLMDHGGYRYWDARINGGPCKRFYLAQPLDLYPGAAERRAVAWIIATAESKS